MLVFGCRKHILGSIMQVQASARQAIMLHALSHLPLMAAEDKVIMDHLRVTPFVDTDSGNLKPPCALHDPRRAPTALELIKIWQHVWAFFPLLLVKQVPR
jgi:hypothetical protein